MPIYNERRTLPLLVERLLAAPLDLELICVDDASSDRSREILSELRSQHKNIRVFIRIGPKFLSAGIGYGGSCFPKDVQAFQAVAGQCNYDFALLTEVMRINAEQRLRFLKKVKSVLWTLRGKRLPVLGLAFKGGTDDIRESPAIAIIQALLKEGSQNHAYDPAAISKAKRILPEESVPYASDPYDAATGCDALLILTEWKEFANLDLRKIRSLLKHPIVIDGRNLYPTGQMTTAGLIYYSVGRPVGVPEPMSSIVTHHDNAGLRTPLPDALRPEIGGDSSLAPDARSL